MDRRWAATIGRLRSSQTTQAGCTLGGFGGRPGLEVVFPYTSGAQATGQSAQWLVVRHAARSLTHQAWLGAGPPLISMLHSY